MNIRKPVAIDASINAYLEESFFINFVRTRKLHNDYWYIWCRSGLLNFVCQKMRKKYAIPKLDINKDYHSIEEVVGDKSVTIDTFDFFDKWKKKKQFKKELKSIILQLRLHRSAYSSLFNKIFYYIPLSLTEKWEGFDTESVFHITSPLEDNFYPLGYTNEEIKIIRNEIVSNLTDNYKKQLSKKQMTTINNWCKKQNRTVKVPNNKKYLCQIIRQMKRYKTLRKGINDAGDVSDKLRQTSARCANNVTTKISDDKGYNPEAFRQIVRRLYKSFPILSEYISA